MKRFLKLGLSLLVAGGVVGTALGVANRPVEAAKAADESTTRVYAVLKGGWDGKELVYGTEEFVMYAQLSNNGEDATVWDAHKMTRVLGKDQDDKIDLYLGYWCGVFYADVPSNYTHIKFHCNVFGIKNESVMVSLDQFYQDGIHLAAFVSPWISDDVARTVEMGAIPCNAKQAAQLFSSSHVDICNDYDLYPLMNDLFIFPSGGWETTENEAEGTRYDTTVVSNEYNGETSFTLDAVLNQFERQYNIHSTSTSNIAIIKEEDFTMIIIVVSILSVSAIGLIAFVSKKRKRA